MTESMIAYTDLADSGEAGAYLGTTLSDALEGSPPDAVIVFASPRYDYTTLLKSLEAACTPGILVGCSSAGEFISTQQGVETACAIGLRSSEITFSVGVGRNLGGDVRQAAADIVTSFTGVGSQPALFHAALVMTDALAGQADELVEQLNLLTGGTYRFFGGGAGDDARFERTQVFHGTDVLDNAAVALEMLSRKPIGIGVRHGWKPASAPLRVTEVDGMRLVSLNAAPAVEVFESYAEETGQAFDRKAPLSFFLHNVLGIDTGSGFKLRVPLSVTEDGSIACAAEIPEGATVHIMRAEGGSAAEAAASATQDAIEQLQGNAPEVALFFDCVATRLRLGQEFGVELQALEASLGTAKYAGCNTYGQVARSVGQFSGFHNCTAVVCVIPS